MSKAKVLFVSQQIEPYNEEPITHDGYKAGEVVSGRGGDAQVGIPALLHIGLAGDSQIRHSVELRPVVLVVGDGDEQVGFGHQALRDLDRFLFDRIRNCGRTGRSLRVIIQLYRPTRFFEHRGQLFACVLEGFMNKVAAHTMIVVARP